MQCGTGRVQIRLAFRGPRHESDAATAIATDQPTGSQPPVTRRCHGHAGVTGIEPGHLHAPPDIDPQLTGSLGEHLLRGFDNVSVAEVAEVANVSKMTVFNYFPRKEDLMLDRYPELLDAVSAAVRGRRRGESPLSALRRLLLDFAERRHPLGGPRDGVQPFLRTVRDSPTLLAREREFRDELTATLAGLIAEANGTDPAAHRTRLAAALAVAAWETVRTTTHDELLAGERADDIAEAHATRLNQAFEALDQALAAC